MAERPADGSAGLRRRPRANAAPRRPAQAAQPPVLRCRTPFSNEVRRLVLDQRRVEARPVPAEAHGRTAEHGEAARRGPARVARRANRTAATQRDALLPRRRSGDDHRVQARAGGQSRLVPQPAARTPTSSTAACPFAPSSSRTRPSGNGCGRLPIASSPDTPLPRTSGQGRARHPDLPAAAR